MKSILKFNVSLLLFFIFSITQLQAQNKSLPDLLIGEWTMAGNSRPQINDTISLTRKLLELNEKHPKWKFELPSKLVKNHQFRNIKDNPKAVIEVSSHYKWYYDQNTSLLRIQDEKSDQYFKIISKDDQTIKLICVK